MTNKYSSAYPAKNFYQFENFIAFDANYLAKETAIDFANNKTDYNVLVISSTLGNGATHLAHSILNVIEKADIKKEVYYASYENLSCRFKSNQKDEFFDAEFCNNKSAILIDSYYNEINKYISDNLFSVLENVSTKIIITCTEGVTIPIQHKTINLINPSEVEKEVIIQNLLNNYDFKLPQNIVKYLAKDNKYSARELDGVLISVLANSKLLNSAVNLDLIQKTLSEISVRNSNIKLGGSA
jgi:chromosomal replication initiation ATPase DnaA